MHSELDCFLLCLSNIALSLSFPTHIQFPPLIFPWLAWLETTSYSTVSENILFFINLFQLTLLTLQHMLFMLGKIFSILHVFYGRTNPSNGNIQVLYIILCIFLHCWYHWDFHQNIKQALWAQTVFGFPAQVCVTSFHPSRWFLNMQLVTFRWLQKCNLKSEIGERFGVPSQKGNNWSEPQRNLPFCCLLHFPHQPPSPLRYQQSIR